MVGWLLGTELGLIVGWLLGMELALGPMLGWLLGMDSQAIRIVWFHSADDPQASTATAVHTRFLITIVSSMQSDKSKGMFVSV